MSMQTVREIPRFDTRALFYDAAGRVSPSPSLLALSETGSEARPNARPNAAAIFSMLQLGAVVPPLSPWEGVHRFLPGYRYRGTENLGPVPSTPDSSLSDPDPDRRADALEQLLDRGLQEWIGDREEPVLLFSGGVDSGLIAARLAALGRRDSLLLNYSFGPDDPESRLAEAMARHLGLRFERITMSRSPFDCLEEPGRVWPQPFADVSVAPTSELAQAVAERLSELSGVSGGSRVILDGTGADDSLGMAARIAAWQWVYRIPHPARRAAAFFYRAAGFWTRRSGDELVCRVLTMSSQMPLLAAVLTKNPLAGFLYDDACAGAVHQSLEEWIGSWAGKSDPDRIVAAYLALACANRVAQKAEPILEAAGHDVRYPFLRDDVTAAASAILRPGFFVEPKAVLKHSLARSVPREMVYRPKSGFVDPRRNLYYAPKFIEHLRAAGDPGGPIAGFLERKRVLEACDLLFRNKPLPAYTLYCLWALVFSDRWYRTAGPLRPFRSRSLTSPRAASR